MNLSWFLFPKIWNSTSLQFCTEEYADDTRFLLGSIEELVKTCTLFPSFSGLKPNISK